MDKGILARHKYKIYQGKDGRWRTNVMIGGKRKMIVRVSKKKLEEYLESLYGVDEDITMRGLYPDWIAYKRLHVSEPTVIRLQKSWNKFYSDANIVDTAIKDITKVDLDIWIHQTIKKYGLNRKAYNNYIAILNGLLDYAVDLGIIEHNLKRDIRIGRVLAPSAQVADSEQVYSEEEFSRLRKLAMEDYENGKHVKHELVPLAVVFMFYTGLRLSEIAALRYEDIDGSIMTIQRMYRDSTQEIVEHTKGAYGVRRVLIVPEAKEILSLCREKQTQRRVKTAYVFSMNKDPGPYRAIKQAFYSYCKQLGIAAKSSHKARKTYVSTLLDAGVNISTVQKLVGHVDKQTTLSSYTYDRGTFSDKNRKIEEALSKLASQNDPKNSQKTEK